MGQAFEQGAVVVARVRYKTVDADVFTTVMPDEMLPSALAAPSLVVNVIMGNVRKGMPLFRIEDSLAREGSASIAGRSLGTSAWLAT